MEAFNVKSKNHMLSKRPIIDENSNPKVTLGNTVTFNLLQNGTKENILHTMKLVENLKIFEEELSFDSHLGKLIKDKSAGDVFNYTLNGNCYTVTILNIESQ